MSTFYVNISKKYQYVNKLMSIFQTKINSSLNLCPKHVLLGIIKKLAPQGTLLAPRPTMPAKQASFATWSPVPLYIYIYIYIFCMLLMLLDVYYVFDRTVFCFICFYLWHGCLILFHFMLVLFSHDSNTTFVPNIVRIVLTQMGLSLQFLNC